MSWIKFAAGQRLQANGQDILTVYFPESGLLSVLSGTNKHPVEAGLIGREGMIGAAALLDDNAKSHGVIAQVAGIALAMSVPELKQAMSLSTALQKRLFGFLGSWIIQVEGTVALVGRGNNIHQRLARWLLCAQDRIESVALNITHDRLAYTLGVRRPTVTSALHVLEGEHAIRSERGRIEIRSRDRLLEFAGDAYSEPAADVRVLRPLLQHTDSHVPSEAQRQQ